jgi:UDP-N-acetylglucosamine--N-acetylmuramyl-(pentapeptide) pyrophosphoryl-undecaprenol N-acetylglucosamine transferase
MIKKNFAFIAGGTAGHIFPALALSEILGTTNNIIFITDKRGSKFIDKKQISKIKIMQLQNINGTCIEKIFAAFWIVLATIKCLFWLKKEKIQFIIAFGGLTNLPSLIAAKILKIPFILHEQNALLGRGNKFFAKDAKFIASSFFTTHGLEEYRDKVIVTGNPIRQIVLEVKRRRTKITKDLQILVVGGSQGAKIIDQKVTKALLSLTEIKQENIILFQQAYNLKSIKASYKSSHFKQVIIENFFENLPQLIADSDLIITRGGATTLAEIEYLGIPAIIIPLAAAADNHQFYNAQELVKAGQAMIIEEKNLNELPSILKKMLLKLENFHKKDKNKVNQAAAKLALKVNNWIMNNKL